MMAKRKKSFLQIVMTLLIASLSAPSPVTAEELTATPRSRQWPMKHKEGPEWIDSGTKVIVTIDPSKIVVITKKKQRVVLSIPVARVTGVIYDNQTQRRSKPVWNLVKPVLADPFKAIASLGLGFYKWGEHEKAKQDYERALNDYGIAYQKALGRKPDCSGVFIDPANAADPAMCARLGAYLATRHHNHDALRERVVKLGRGRNEPVYVCTYGCDPLVFVSVLTVGLPTAAVLAPFKKTTHFVHIFWEENRMEKEVVLKVGKRNYPAFLDALEEVTGFEGTEGPRLKRRWEIGKNLARGPAALAPSFWGSRSSPVGEQVGVVDVSLLSQLSPTRNLGLRSARSQRRAALMRPDRTSGGLRSQGGEQ